MSDLECRVLAFEKANRRWRWATIVIGAVLLIGAFSAANAPDIVPDVLRAGRIEVLAPDGEAAIVLEADAHASTLRLSARGPNHRRMIDLSANQESARLTLLKHAEAPLLSARVDDAGSSLMLFDGREPSGQPRSIIMRNACATGNKLGGATITLAKGSRKTDVKAGLCMPDPDGDASLMLGGPKGNTVTLRVNPEDGKLDFLEDRRPDW